VLQILEKKRARYAWECIDEVKRKRNLTIEDRYKSYCKKAPALILTNGIGNTLLFLKSKSTKSSNEEEKGPEKQAYELLLEHVSWCNPKKEKDIIEWIVNDASPIEILRLTRDTLALLGWIKRFAEIELEDDTNGKNTRK
jgi:CRISPR-associated protein Cmr5